MGNSQKDCLQMTTDKGQNQNNSLEQNYGELKTKTIALRMIIEFTYEQN